MTESAEQIETQIETPPTSPAAPDANIFWVPGDFPPRDGVHVDLLIDGRAAMLAMCRAFLAAQTYILLAGWDIRADLSMVRGSDARMGPDGSAEQIAFLARLREEGLSDESIMFWSAGQLRVKDVLGLAVRRGVKVGVLLWDSPEMGVHLTNNAKEQQAQLSEVGVDCVLDSSSRKITHLLEALHQKCAVVDGRIAFIGGVDLTLQANGDYDRWDTHAHPPDSLERGSAREVSMHPWHDAHVRIQGPAVADVQMNIVQRWEGCAERGKAPNWPLELTNAVSSPQSGGVPAQVARTIPPDTYDFAPEGIKSIYHAYARAVNAAQRYIYLESQYFWPEVYRGLDSLLWGKASEEMAVFIEALGAALNRGVSLALVLPDHPNAGRKYSDAGIERVRDIAPDATAAGRFQVYTLGTSQQDPNAPGGILYRPVYVHAKVGIVDDLWMTVGSANLNNRGFVNDAELNVTVVDRRVASQLRVALWTEHAQATYLDVSALQDVERGMAALRAQAQENAGRVERREPLRGHLLPYLTVSDAATRGIVISPEHGWLDSIEGGLGANREEYRNRYI